MDHELKIDSNVPIPPEFGKVARAVRKLKVGDSFVVFNHTDLMAAYQAARKAGIVVISQKKRTSEERRVWRKK